MFWLCFLDIFEFIKAREVASSIVWAMMLNKSEKLEILRFLIGYLTFSIVSFCSCSHIVNISYLEGKLG